MPIKHLRTIIESERFGSERVRFAIDARRLDEALFGVTWGLARDPEIGAETDVESIRAIGIREVGGVPALSVFYTWNDTSVLLLSMTLAITWSKDL